MIPSGFFLLKFAEFPNALSIFQIVLKKFVSSVDLTLNAPNAGGILNFMSTINELKGDSSLDKCITLIFPPCTCSSIALFLLMFFFFSFENSYYG